MRARTRVAVGLLLGAALAPAATAAQTCGVAGGIGVDAAGGAVSYDLGGGRDGTSYGAALVAAPSWIAASGRLRLLDLEDGADPLAGDLFVAIPVLSVAGIQLCPTLRGGISSADTDEAEFLSAVGGVGARAAATIPVGGSRASPYVEVRGLAGWTDARAFGRDLTETAFAVGVELGVQIAVGPVVLHASGTLDGLDDGLGLPPYPNRTVEAGLGLRF